MTIGPIAPLFIVSSVADSVAFYERLGFALRFAIPGDDPFFLIVGRDTVEIHLKFVADDVKPQPNSAQHEWAQWDAFVFAPDPDALAAEFGAQVADREDGLRGFKMRDPDGYILFFGRPSLPKTQPDRAPRS